MRADFIEQLLSESIDKGKGKRSKNLKVYICFFVNGHMNFEIDVRQQISEGNDNEYHVSVQNYDLFFDEWDWGMVAYHAHEEEGTRAIEQFLTNHSYLRKPWLLKNSFYNFIDELIQEGGRIANQRSKFEPYNEYSGYGLNLQVSGPKTKEVIDEMESKYAVHPKRVGIEIEDGDGLIKFDITTKGRMSFSRGLPTSIILMVSKFTNFIVNNDKKYDFTQSRMVQKNDGLIVREINETIKINMPSLEKIRGGREERNRAIISMLTNGKTSYGYIGIPIGPDRANILDLSERKMLQVTIVNDSLLVYTENPSQARTAIRRLVSYMATHIDPDSNFEKIVIGEQ